jgi:DNA helicase HerA-like ATPase
MITGSITMLISRRRHGSVTSVSRTTPLIFSARTEGYKGEAIKGVVRIFEASGDFVSGVFRVVPHANDPKRFQPIIKQMKSV